MFSQQEIDRNNSTRMNHMRPDYFFSGMNLNKIAYETDTDKLEHFYRDRDFLLAEDIDGDNYWFVFHWAVQSPAETPDKRKVELPEKLSLFDDLVNFLKRESYSMSVKMYKPNMAKTLAEIYSRLTHLKDNILHLLISNKSLSDEETLQFVKKLFEHMPLEVEQQKLINHKNNLDLNVVEWAMKSGKVTTSKYLQSIVKKEEALREEDVCYKQPVV